MQQVRRSVMPLDRVAPVGINDESHLIALVQIKIAVAPVSNDIMGNLSDISYDKFPITCFDPACVSDLASHRRVKRRLVDDQPFVRPAKNN